MRESEREIKYRERKRGRVRVWKEVRERDRT